jgi:hypothetical protein
VKTEEHVRSLNPKDEIRRNMLRYFYDRAQNARSKTGKHGIAVKISELKADMKRLYGYTQPQVISNLHYLIDRRWVNDETETRQVPTKRGILIPSATHYYEISAAGIDKTEGGSEFERPEPFAGINIEATGSNVITVGEGNYVQADYRRLFSDLADLRAEISSSSEVSEEQKFSAAVDILTIQDQLAKPNPDGQVMKRLWGGIEKIANLAGLVQFATEIGKAITQLG